MGVLDEVSFSHIPVASAIGPTNNTYFMGDPGSNLGIWRAGDLYTQKQTFTDPKTGKNYDVVGWSGVDQFGNPIPVLQDPTSSSGGMFYGTRNPTTGEYSGVQSVPMGIGGQVYMPGFGGGASTPPTTGNTPTPATSATPPAKAQGITLTPTAIAIGAAIAVGAMAFIAVKKGWIKIGKLR